MTRLILAVVALCAAGCQTVEVRTGKPCAEVEQRIRDYYAAKYPSFAELVALRQVQDTTRAADKRTALCKICPVAEIVHSYAPGGRYLTFEEKTAASPPGVSILSLDLVAEKDGTCRVDARVRKRKQQPGEPVAAGRSLSEAELRALMK